MTEPVLSPEEQDDLRGRLSKALWYCTDQLMEGLIACHGLSKGQLIGAQAPTATPEQISLLRERFHALGDAWFEAAEQTKREMIIS